MLKRCSDSTVMGPGTISVSSFVALGILGGRYPREYLRLGGVQDPTGEGRGLLGPDGCVAPALQRGHIGVKAALGS